TDPRQRVDQFVAQAVVIGAGGDRPFLQRRGLPEEIDGFAGAPLGLRQLLASDRHFDAGRFMEGAEAAYRMILEAFWSGDRDTLRDLCDDDSYEAFVEAIEAREKRGETLDNRLIGIDSAKITAVELSRSEARITVRYQADISAITRDADGKLVSGSMSDAAQTDDLWTFRRAIGSNDPNWLLDEADVA
ncbi:MAG: Tim44 domain-containing protein, partial [Sphingopyxis sp.]|nr:Tim44 domain-containing protein [Sphingopyxis sp.]